MGKTWLTLTCAAKGCNKAFVTTIKGKKFCSDKCRIAHCQAENIIRKDQGAIQFKAKPRDKARRAEQDRWRRLMYRIQAEFTIEEARQIRRAHPEASWQHPVPLH